MQATNDLPSTEFLGTNSVSFHGVWMMFLINVANSRMHVLIVSSHLGSMASFWATDVNPAEQRDPLDAESGRAGPVLLS